MAKEFDDIRIEPTCNAAVEASRARWNSIAKPLGALGCLEDAVAKICGLTGSERLDIARRCAVVLCADNGVVCEGVSQSGQEVTAVVAEQVARGTSSVCRMAVPVGIDCVAVDIGMAPHAPIEGLRDLCVRRGTANIAEGPAMTRAEAEAAVRAGIGLARDLREEGYGLVAVGEMGIGNTTTAAAVASALLGLDPALTCGRGAGLADEALVRKRRVVARALAVNEPDPQDPLDVLAKVGGLDICGMCGLFLGGALWRVPMIVDGYISSVAALCALRLVPECEVALLGSHLSTEPGAKAVEAALGLDMPLHLGMHLGEGTGAICLIPLLDMALGLYREGDSFAAWDMEPYEVMEP